jgi:hypothetical protein
MDGRKTDVLGNFIDPLDWGPDIRIDIICRECGSRDVTRDATAEWCTTTQQWVIQNVFDNADCNDCGGETKLEERDLLTGEVVEWA